MKNIFLKTLCGAMLAISMLAVFAQISVSAQDKGNEEEIGVQTDDDLFKQGLGNETNLEGSWDVQATRINCQTGAALTASPAMFTFMRGGTLQNDSVGIPRSSGHGVWSHLGGRRFFSSFQFFRFNADGTLAGRQVVRQYIELHILGNDFTATNTGQNLDVNGSVIATSCASLTGTRFR